MGFTVLDSISIILSIVSIVSLSFYINILRIEDKNANYKDNIGNKIGIISLGFICLCFAIFLHIKQNPTNSIYVLLLLTSLGFGITFGALYITIISKL